MSEERESLEPPLDTDFVDRYAASARPKPVARPRVRGRRPSIFGPLFLIAIGSVLLLDQLGSIDLDWWLLLGRYWPVILILAGLDQLLGRRSILGGIVGVLVPLAVIVGVFWLVFGGLPAWVSFQNDAGVRREQVDYPLGDLAEARVFLNLGSRHTVIQSLDNPDNLLEAVISTSGTVEFNASERGSRAELSLGTRAPTSGDLFSWQHRRNDDWRIQLSPQVALDLELDCGSGSGEYDLRELDLDSLVVDGGSGSFDLYIPAGRDTEIAIDVGSGSMGLVLPSRGDLELVIEGGTGETVIELPGQTAMRIEIESGSGAFLPSDRLELVEGEHNSDGIWETAGYDRAENRIQIRIIQGSGAVRIQDL